MDKYREEFLLFVREIQENILRDAGGEISPYTELSVEDDFDVDDPNNHERIILECWNSSASRWPIIESETTYYGTMDFFMQKIGEASFPTGKTCRIISLGSGPGLYEIFLGHWLRAIGKKVRITCIDYSPGMIDFQKSILDKPGKKIGGVKIGPLKDLVDPVVGDMTDLKRFHRKTDILICNNSMQWASDWTKAIEEMSRCMNPKGLKLFIGVVHPHAMTMMMGDMKISRPLVEQEDLFDRLEEGGFQIKSTRTMLGHKGQMGSKVQRLGILCDFHPNGVEAPWRSLRQTSGSVTGIRLS